MFSFRFKKVFRVLVSLSFCLEFEDQETLRVYKLGHFCWSTGSEVEIIKEQVEKQTILGCIPIFDNYPWEDGRAVYEHNPLAEKVADHTVVIVGWVQIVDSEKECWVYLNS